MKNESKRVLMVVFEFPRCNGGSVQRILSVYNGFIEAGWIVDVLTIREEAYDNVVSELPFMLETRGNIVRAFGVDAQKNLSIKGKHLGWLSSPDRWGKTWIPSAVHAGRKMIHKAAPDLIWSSSPTPSPHFIAQKLLKIVPSAKWIADYRDPFPYMHGLSNPLVDQAHKKVDRLVLEHAHHLTFATKEMAKLFFEKANNAIEKPHSIVENGFSFKAIARVRLGVTGPYDSPFPPPVSEEGNSRPLLTLYYAGILYHDGRDPTALFNAIKRYKKEIGDVRLVFQGAGDGSEYNEVLTQLELLNNVKFYSGVSFNHALSNMMKADVLVLIQDEKFNNQVPGKLYEYIATNNRVLVKSPNNSASTKVAIGFDGVYVGYSDDELYEQLKKIHDSKQQGEVIKRGKDIAPYSREHQFKTLLHCANSLCTGNE